MLHIACSAVGDIVVSVEMARVDRITDAASWEREGRMLPAIDVAEVFGMPPPPGGGERRAFEVSTGATRYVLLVGGEVRIREMDETALQPLPALIAKVGEVLGVRALVCLSPTFVYLLDPDAIARRLEAS